MPKTETQIQEAEEEAREEEARDEARREEAAREAAEADMREEGQGATGGVGADESGTSYEKANHTDAEVPSSPDQTPPPEPEASPKLIAEMHDAYNYWHTNGFPEKAAVLWECIQQKRRPPANLLPSNDTGINPETSINPELLNIPPRHGPGATHEAWREFAKQVLDMEPEIIETLDRKDVIRILEDKKVIEGVESPTK